MDLYLAREKSSEHNSFNGGRSWSFCIFRISFKYVAFLYDSIKYIQKVPNNVENLGSWNMLLLSYIHIFIFLFFLLCCLDQGDLMPFLMLNVMSFQIISYCILFKLVMVDHFNRCGNSLPVVLVHHVCAGRIVGGSPGCASKV